VPLIPIALMNVTQLNAFCRRFDMIFVEMGSIDGEDVYWFVDFNNERRYYSGTEIESKMSS